MSASRGRIAICWCYLHRRTSHPPFGALALLIKVVILLTRTRKRHYASSKSISRSKSLKELVQPIAPHKVTELTIACGVDVHKKFFVATLLVRASDQKKVAKFGRRLEDLLSFKSWRLEHHCRHVAVESTGVLWWPLYAALQDQIQIFVVNAFKIKDKAEKKSDRSDSERMALLLLKGQLDPSYIPGVEREALRSLARFRVKHVETRTRYKNRVHKILEKTNIRLGSVLSDVFGAAGKEVLRGLMEGQPPQEIVARLTHKRIREKQAQLEEILQTKLCAADILILRQCLEVIEQCDTQIKELNNELTVLVKKLSLEQQLGILLSIPGVSFISAALLLAKIDEISRLLRPEHLVSYVGLASTTYQYGGKLVTGHITKRGSWYLRRTMVQVAHALVYAKHPLQLKKFFHRLVHRKGKRIAIVALARKVLALSHHLLTQGELFEDGYFRKRAKPKVPRGRPELEQLSRDQMITMLKQAGYTVRSPVPSLISRPQIKLPAG